MARRAKGRKRAAQKKSTRAKPAGSRRAAGRRRRRPATGRSDQQGLRGHVDAFHPGVGRVLSLYPGPPSLPITLRYLLDVTGTASDGAIFNRSKLILVDPYVSTVAVRYLAWASGAYLCEPLVYSPSLSPLTDIVAAAGDSAAYDRSLSARRVNTSLRLLWGGRSDACSGFVAIGVAPNLHKVLINSSSDRNTLLSTLIAHPHTKVYPMSYFSSPRVVHVPVQDFEERARFTYMRTSEGNTALTSGIPEFDEPGMPCFHQLFVLPWGWHGDNDAGTILRVEISTKIELMADSNSAHAFAALPTAGSSPGAMAAVAKVLGDVRNAAPALLDGVHTMAEVFMHDAGGMLAGARRLRRR